jgi:hypothetical protein
MQSFLRYSSYLTPGRRPAISNQDATEAKPEQGDHSARSMTLQWFGRAYGRQSLSTKALAPEIRREHAAKLVEPQADPAAVALPKPQPAASALSKLARQPSFTSHSGAPNASMGRPHRLRDLIDTASVDDTIDEERFAEPADERPQPTLRRAHTIMPSRYRRLRGARDEGNDTVRARDTMDAIDIMLLRQKLRIGLTQFLCDKDNTAPLDGAIGEARNIFKGMSNVTDSQRQFIEQLLVCLQELAAGELTVSSDELKWKIDQLDAVR